MYYKEFLDKNRENKDLRKKFALDFVNENLLKNIKSDGLFFQAVNP
jgi:hypothetical protein